MIGRILGANEVEKKIHEGVEKWKHEMQIWLESKLKKIEDKLDRIERKLDGLK